MKKQRLFYADGGIISDETNNPQPLTGWPPDKSQDIVEPLARNSDTELAAEQAFAMGRMVGTPERRPGFRIGSYFWRLDDVLTVVLTLCAVALTVKRLRH